MFLQNIRLNKRVDEVESLFFNFGYTIISDSTCVKRIPIAFNAQQIKAIYHMVYVESCCTHITSDKTQINVKSKKF